MGASKVVTTIVDRSTLLPAQNGIYAIIAFQTSRGSLEPQLVSSQDDLKNKFGSPQLKYGTGYFSAKGYLTQSNTLWVKRVVSETARYSGIIVKGKIDSKLSDTEYDIASPDFIPEAIVNPYFSVNSKGQKVYGLTKNEIDTFTFEQYPSLREYSQVSDVTILSASDNVARIRVSLLDPFEVGMHISVGSKTPANTAPLFTITGLETAPQFLEKVTVQEAVTAKAGDKVWSVKKSVQRLSNTLASTCLTGTDVLTLDTTSGIHEGDELVINDLETVIVKSIDDRQNQVTLASTVAETLDHSASTIDLVTRAGKLITVLTRSATGSSEIFVEASDDIINNNRIIITDASVDEHSFKTYEDGNLVLKKDLFEESWYYLNLDNKVSVSVTDHIYKLLGSDLEERDAMFIYSENPGDWSNKLAIATSPSKNYDNGFVLTVYEDGLPVEEYEGTCEPFIDGFGNQKFIEEMVNGRSSRIKVKYNTELVDADGKVMLPLFTTYCLWRQDSTEIFYDYDTPVTTLEDVLKGDLKIVVTDTANISMGDRIKFKVSNILGDEITREYKVQEKQQDADGNHVITLDRPFAEDELPLGASVIRFNPENNDPATGIYAGRQYFAISKLTKTYPSTLSGSVVYNYVLDEAGNSVLTPGILLDAGTNLFTGGSDGDLVTQADFINAYKVFENASKYPGQLILDGGYTTKAFAKYLVELKNARKNGHVYLSSRLSDELSANYLNDIVEYFTDLGIDDADVSFYAGWQDYFDPDLQMTVQISPDGPAAACQSFTTRQYSFFYPAGGYDNGKVTYSLKTVRDFSEGDQDYLVDNRINPFITDEGSIILWGNETSLRKPSPLQIRSVAMLTLYIKHSVDGMLKYKTFTANNSTLWGQIQGAIDVFMRDQILARGGVYAYKVAVGEVTTDSDIDNRTVNVFIGIQPTSDTKFINCKIAIFNKASEITVSW